MSGWGWGALVFFLAFFGLGVLVVVAIFALRGRDGTSTGGGYTVGDVAGIPIRVGG